MRSKKVFKPNNNNNVRILRIIDLVKCKYKTIEVELKICQQKHIKYIIIGKIKCKHNNNNNNLIMIIM